MKQTSVKVLLPVTIILTQISMMDERKKYLIDIVNTFQHLHKILWTTFGNSGKARKRKSIDVKKGGREVVYTAHNVGQGLEFQLPSPSTVRYKEENLLNELRKIVLKNSLLNRISVKHCDIQNISTFKCYQWSKQIPRSMTFQFRCQGKTLKAAFWKKKLFGLCITIC